MILLNKKILLLFVLNLFGCAEDVLQEATPDDIKEQMVWTLNFTQSGGIAGNFQVLIINFNGQASLKQKRAATLQTITLGATELSKIAHLVRSLLDSNPPRKRNRANGTCYDCFFYQLVIESEERTFKGSFRDFEQPNLTYAELVEQLLELRVKIIDS